MKIRIRGNSLRYRLTKSEVARLKSEGYLQERTEFADQVFVYAIETATNNKLAANFLGNKIVIYMPKAMIDELNDTDKVGFEDQNGPVRLLIEKDFVCIDNVDEDQSDNYPNPYLTC